ncbi:UPF0182 family protein [Gemmatimonas phototrophica]|uniref:Uncharacterized protein n=1 Tax=Gemmatimonas phototrophica TaxID=1379270 RepID=A0A143BIQ5_9BACT|nr:UPF0182 family protein [Gemmatimonas phototrophica]AMW04927.1 hypothetical protein GEMMAAP_08930 [Gemmatimonas phototrophica]
MGARAWLLIGAAIAAVLLLVGRTATALVVDHAWFASIGAPALFWEQVVDTLLLQGGAWVAGSLFAFANLHAVRQTIHAVAIPSRVANIELTAMVPGKRLLSVTIVLALLVGAVLAVPLTNWETLALVRHGLPFGEIEGIFDRDLGHYVYWLPFEETLYVWSLVNVVSLTAMVLVLYALTRSLRLEGRRLAASNHVRRHLSVLGALVLLLLAWSYRLDGFDLLLQGSGPDGLFLRVDHRVTLRMDAVLSYGSAIAALIILRTGWAGHLRAAFVTLTIVLVAAVGLRHVVPAVLARGDLLGDPARRDGDYVAARALYSRRAFDVDAIRLVAADTGVAAPVPTRTATLPQRTSLWDALTLAQGLGEAASGAPRPGVAQGSTAAPSLVDAAAPGWAMINGRLSALRVLRPLSDVEPWKLSVVDATHPVVRDSTVAPWGTADEDARGPWPLVGPGVQGARLLDAADAPEVQGAMLDTPQARLAHAWAMRDLALLKADSVSGAPLLVTHRDVRERIRRLAPVFVQGAHVYPVRDGDRLYWILHLYSASDRYPLSQRWQVAGGIYSYFKRAATAVVDAGTGRVRLVAAPRPDALARTWMARVPAVYSPASALPLSLLAAIPPATDGAIAQLRTFARFGSRADGSQQRHFPDSALAGGEPAPFLVEQGATTRLAWSVALLSANDDVAGVATVTGGADQMVWWSPAAAGGQRWPTLLERLRAFSDSAQPAPADSGRREARVRLGRAEPLVTSRGLLLVQTVQLTRGDGRLVLARVLVTDGVAVGAGATLADALTMLGERVSGGLLPGSPAPVVDWEGTDDVAARWYDAMRHAMKQGNWSAFGAAFDSLGRALGRPPQ